MKKQLEKYSFHISKSAITICWSTGQTTVIPSDDVAYGKARALLRDKASESDLRAAIEPLRVVAQWSGGAIVMKDKAAYCQTPAGLVPVHPKLNAVMLEFVRNKWPAEPFCRFVYRLSQNPSARSVETFHEFIDKYGLTITQSGMVRGYKAITNDWKDKHTGTIDNRIGDRPTMARNLVDDNPDKGCSFGFHCGCLQYVLEFAYGYGKPDGDRIVLVEFDPIDVVCVPRDCSCGKIRCSSYTIVGEYEGELAAYADAGLKANVPAVTAATTPVKAPANAPKFCSACGAKLRKDAKFCGECGSAV